MICSPPVLRQKAVGQKLRDRNGIVRADGIAAQTRRHEEPRADRADQQTDGDPHLADAVQVDRAGQTHQHPRAHVRRAGGQRRDPAAHVAPAEEVFLLALLLAVLKEEVHADADDEGEVQQHGHQFNRVHDFHSNSLENLILFSLRKNTRILRDTAIFVKIKSEFFQKMTVFPVDRL